MSRFTELQVEYVDKVRRKLTKEFTYRDEIWGEITVPAGFVTDLASIQKLRLIPGLYVLLAKYGNHAAVIHDWLYHDKPRLDGFRHHEPRITRREADRTFYRALRAEGIARWRASMFYMGVRLLGRKGWKKTNPKD